MVFRFSNGADPRFLTEVYGTTSREQWSGVVKPARAAIRQWRVKVLGASRGNNCAWSSMAMWEKSVLYGFHRSLNIIVINLIFRSY